MADFPVKWFAHDMEGAPDLYSVTIGSLKEFLNTILVTGFNEKSVDSLTYDAVTGEGILEISAGHGYNLNQIIEISGVDQDEYNGQWRVNSITTYLVRFRMDAAPATNGTGNVTVRTPGAGWTMPYESADGFRALFKPNNNDASGCYFYVDNSDWQTSSWGPVFGEVFDYRCLALIRGCEDATDIDSRVNEFGSGLYVKEINSIDMINSVRGYRVVADDKTVYIQLYDYARPAELDSQNCILAFGDLVSQRSGHRDAFIILQDSDDEDPPPQFFGDLSSSSFKRVSSGVTVSDRNVPMRFLAMVGKMSDRAYSPDVSTPKQEIQDVVYALAYDSARSTWLRAGKVPGLGYLLSGNSPGDRTFIEIEGRLFWCLEFNSGAEPQFSGPSTYTAIFDLGSWR